MITGSKDRVEQRIRGAPSRIGQMSLQLIHIRNEIRGEAAFIVKNRYEEIVAFTEPCGESFQRFEHARGTVGSRGVHVVNDPDRKAGILCGKDINVLRRSVVRYS